MRITVVILVIGAILALILAIMNDGHKPSSEPTETEKMMLEYADKHTKPASERDKK